MTVTTALRTIRLNTELLDARERAWPVEIEVALDGKIVGAWCDKRLTGDDEAFLQEMADELAEAGFTESRTEEADFRADLRRDLAA